MHEAFWALTTITPPYLEPITLNEAKLHLRRDDITADDALITALIAAARTHLENVTSRAFNQQTLELVFDDWPCEDSISIPRPLLQSVSSIKYTDSSGTETTWTTADYIVDTDSKPGRVSLAYNAVFPNATLRPVAAIKVRYVAGHGREFTFSADATTNLMTAAAHGVIDGSDMILRSSATLPTGLSADTRYFVVSGSANSFSLSATKGGSAIDITGAGSGTHTATIGIPLTLRQALLLLIGHYYQNRESVLVGGFGLVAAEMPQSVAALIAPYRIWSF